MRQIALMQDLPPHHEIEAVLQEHPAVISTCVIGVPDEKVGERIKAFVVLKENIKGVSAYELIKW